MRPLEAELTWIVERKLIFSFSDWQQLYPSLRELIVGYFFSIERDFICDRPGSFSNILDHVSESVDPVGDFASTLNPFKSCR